MGEYVYPLSLAVISALVAILEHLFPWRPTQKQLRPALWSDAVHLAFNSHFLGILLAGLSTTWVLPYVDRWLGAAGLTDAVYRNAAASWPLWAQIIVAMVVLDFVQWCVHNLLHRVPWLWELHKTHHSVKDGEMDWIVSFRFSWLEVMVYKAILYTPLVFFGFSGTALMVHAVFGTLIGHLNHANLDLGHGAWRYVLNSPRMHIWHHDYDGDARTTVNFGIIFSTWDWIFGTAKMPSEPPKALGFAGVETFPQDFFGQEAWPLPRLSPSNKHKLVWSLAGAALLTGAWLLREPLTSGAAATTPMLAEPAAASQPSSVTPPKGAYSNSPAEAEAALARFGTEAKQSGYAHPEAMVSVAELARALGAPSLVLLDVRATKNFEIGHIPGARQLDRDDYSVDAPIPGLSRSLKELEAMLIARGIRQDSTVVLYADGGPEPYRLWWTLREVTQYPTRVLDGGLVGWKAAGHRVAAGAGIAPAPGKLALAAPAAPKPQFWTETHAFIEQRGARILDTRSLAEYKGDKVHRDAARGGHIPDAQLLEWLSLLRDPAKDHRLRTPTQLRAMFARFGIDERTPVVTYCQSGTRSAAVYYALYQLGASPDQLVNYAGSWAEYSRLDLPAAR